MPLTPPPSSPPPWDPARRWVRIVEERGDGMVEFEFAVGEPDLFVEMLMSREAFDDFCRVQVAERLAPRPALGVAGADGLGWSLHDARTQRFDRSEGRGEDAEP